MMLPPPCSTVDMGFFWLCAMFSVSQSASLNFFSHQTKNIFPIPGLVWFDRIFFPKSCFLFVTFVPCQFITCLSHLCPQNFFVFLVLNLSLVFLPGLSTRSPELGFLDSGLSWTELLACWNYFCLRGATFCCGLSFYHFHLKLSSL